ncbi:hypothetical protein DPEC_G00316680 [Dallia pectoralis]|uniref:Uncharacterized protein n=1 Tax=Dallia pectoralis TaxID=75939 RepID=A0ACC2FD21_DALPE|nr:hypothetical protein DPEC_G00316680 [Dallia pectoralis]
MAASMDPLSECSSGRCAGDHNVPVNYKGQQASARTASRGLVGPLELRVTVKTLAVRLLSGSTESPQ